MIENTKLPCTDCIVLSICKGIKHRHMFTLINMLGNRCSLIYNYLTLRDLDMDFPSLTASKEYEDQFSLRQKPRIITLHAYMNWDYQLEQYLDIFPKTKVK